MTTNNPRTRKARRWLLCIGTAACAVLAGCKSSNNNGNGRGGDPLVAGPNRIPPQNVPVPERGIGRNGKSDPLLGSPTAKNDRTGVGYTDDPERFKGTYIPNKSSTPAALASGQFKDGDDLKIEGTENRVPLQQTGASTAVRPGEPAPDSLSRELAQLNIKREDQSLTHENGKCFFRAAVPISANGQKRQYTGVGDTEEEAIRDLLEQVQFDRK
jgi:hypothetical protein